MGLLFWGRGVANTLAQMLYPQWQAYSSSSGFHFLAFLQHSMAFYFLELHACDTSGCSGSGRWEEDV